MLIERPTIAADEALNGYLLRLAECNGLMGIQHLLEPAQVKPRASYSAEQIARIANVLDYDRQPLLDANLTNSRAAHPDVNAQFAPAARLPVCPLCFAERPVIRREWLNVLTPVCTKHGVLLVDQCNVCETPMTWRRASLSRCDCGADLMENEPVEAPAFTRALSCAVHGHDQATDTNTLLPAPLVDQGSDQSDHLAWFLTCHATDPGGFKVMKRPRPINTEEAVSLLETHLAPVFANWPAGMQQLLSDIDAASPHHSSGVSKQLGSWYRELHRNFGQDRFQWLHDEVAQFVAEHLVLTVNDRVTRIPTFFGEIKGWLSVVEAARIIGVGSERLRDALRHGDVEGEVRHGGPTRDFGFIRRHVVEKLRQSRNRYVDALHARTLLDVSKRQLKRLVEVGGVIYHDEDNRPALVDAPYLAEELRELIERIESRHQSWPSKKHGAPIVLGDIQAVRGRGEEYVLRAYRAILRGDVIPREVRKDAIGMSRFVFDEDELNVIALPNPHDVHMTLTQLCDMTGWKPESVHQWVAHGFLKAERIPNGAKMTTLIRVDDLVYFLSRHIILAVMAKESGTQSRELTFLLEHQGCDVHSFDYPSRRGKLGSIVRMEDMGILLQEVCRPDRFQG